jgi:hypothetical protein
LGMGYPRRKLCNLPKSHYGFVYRMPSKLCDSFLRRMHGAMGSL